MRFWGKAEVGWTGKSAGSAVIVRGRRVAVQARFLIAAGAPLNVGVLTNDIQRLSDFYRSDCCRPRGD
jgi:hypothetical protein